MAEAQRNPFMEQIQKNINSILSKDMKRKVVPDGKGSASVQSYITLEGGTERVISEITTSIDKINTDIANLTTQKTGIAAKMDAQIAELESTKKAIVDSLKA